MKERTRKKLNNMLVPLRHKSTMQNLTDDALKKGDNAGQRKKQQSKPVVSKVKEECGTTNLQQLQGQIFDTAVANVVEKRKIQREEDFSNLMAHVVHKYKGVCETQPTRSTKALLEPDEKNLLRLLRKETTTIENMEELRTHMTSKIMWLIHEYNEATEKADMAEEKYKLLLQSVHRMDYERSGLSIKLTEMTASYAEMEALHRDIEFAFREKCQNLEKDVIRLKERFNAVKARVQQMEKEKKQQDLAVMGGGASAPIDSGIESSLKKHQRSFEMPVHESLSEEIETELAGLRPIHLLEDELNKGITDPLYAKCKELAEKLKDNHAILHRAATNELIYKGRVMEAEEEMTRARDAYERLQRIHEEDVKQHQTLLMHLRDKHIEQLRDIESSNVVLEAEAGGLRSSHADLKLRHKGVLARMRDLQEITLKSPSVPILLSRLHSGESMHTIAGELRQIWELLLTFHDADTSGIVRTQVKQRVSNGTQTDAVNHNYVLEEVVEEKAASPRKGGGSLPSNSLDPTGPGEPAEPNLSDDDGSGEDAETVDSEGPQIGEEAKKSFLKRRYDESRVTSKVNIKVDASPRRRRSEDTPMEGPGLTAVGIRKQSMPRGSKKILGGGGATTDTFFSEEKAVRDEVIEKALSKKLTFRMHRAVVLVPLKQLRL